ncbi:hypothetical protein CHLNCDRAFT_49515 [Chlorella variabilis]|uniref:Peptidase S8/S53 domain-containing protein n=1 Tax=Chlorella variabilis TaxID=554065 RepID=E1Z2R5_CHLVA|nr:hypothetical protein CHLNCDRAFT_49515 [Chlorella variabilis]EFN59710.1 hypothetical protein CHLNCDRAFT_49515 [Chlorella variabilis]|eukprot:XP_005851812.1 hypothetical protein CHLNCDRAFT_49515 [Chlorella variabilis]
MLSPRLPLLPLLLLACSFRCITAQVRRVAWVGPAQLAAATAATASCRCRPAPTSATLQGSFSSNSLILSQTRPSHNLQAGSNEPPRLIVQLSGGGAAASAAGGGDDAVGIASAAPGISNVKLLSPSLNMVTVQVASGSVAQTLASLQRRPDVVFAEVDHPVYLGNRVHYQRIKAQLAWPTISNASSVLTCVIDTGVMWSHPDLKRNLHRMPIAYVKKNTDDNGHGTHVAGILGAVGNNGIGIAGTALTSNVLACKALDSKGQGTVSTVVECIDVCRANRADIINLSVNTFSNSQALRAAIRAATMGGALFVNSAGNNKWDVDTSPVYPSKYNIPGLVAVAGTNTSDMLEPRSNWGVKTIELAAPGYQIFSTILPGYKSYNYRCGGARLYCYEDGTSQAAPFVAGAAALAKAASRRRLSNVQLAQLLMETSDPVPRLKRKVTSGGIINVNKLIRRVLRVCPAGPGRCQEAAAPSPDRLLTDRTSYIAYLESQLERVSAACLTVSSFDGRLEEAVSAVRLLEDKTLNLARLISTAQQFAEQQGESVGEVCRRLRAVEARLAELEQPGRAAEWEDKLRAVSARVDSQAAQLEATAEQRLKAAAAELQAGLEEACHGSHLHLERKLGEAAGRLTEVERRVRAVDEYAHQADHGAAVADLAGRLGSVEDSVAHLAKSDCGMKSTLGSLQAAVGQLKTAMVAVELRPLGAAAADSADCLQASRAC